MFLFGFVPKGNSVCPSKNISVLILLVISSKYLYAKENINLSADLKFCKKKLSFSRSNIHYSLISLNASTVKHTSFFVFFNLQEKFLTGRGLAILLWVGTTSLLPENIVFGCMFIRKRKKNITK